MIRSRWTGAANEATLPSLTNPKPAEGQAGKGWALVWCLPETRCPQALSVVLKGTITSSRVSPGHL